MKINSKVFSSIIGPLAASNSGIGNSGEYGTSKTSENGQIDVHVQVVNYLYQGK